MHNSTRIFALVPIFTLFSFLVSSTTTAQPLDDVETRIIEWIEDHEQDEIEFLQRVVDINSGTMNPEGVRAVGDVYTEAFEEIGMDVRWIDLSEVNRAGHVFAQTNGSQGKKLLLIGHLDTVFERDSPFQQWEVVNDTMVAGPGTEDMKGGNTVILYALKALHAAGVLENTQIVVALTGDEEYPGRPIEISRHDLIEAAIEADVALGFEAGVGSMHSATVARRGYTGWELNVTGKRGHSSLIFSENYGAGGAFETARILNEWYNELADEKNLTFGAGILLGGTTISYDSQLNSGTAFGKTNVIPQTVKVAGDLRALSIGQRDSAKAKMEAIVNRYLPRTSAELVWDDSYPPMAPTEGNYRLFAMLDQVGRDLGYPPLELIEPSRRGAADISFAAPYADGLAGLGPVGEGGHTTEEKIDIRSMGVATKKAALLIYRLTSETDG